jgi:hypothetical protein
VNALKDAPTLALPLDFPRPGKLSGRGAIVHFTLPAVLVKNFTGRAGGVGGCTPFVAFLAAWQLLLAR